MYMNGNYGYGVGTFSLIMVFVIKILIVLFVITLFIGLLMAVKNYLFTPQDFVAFRSSFAKATKPNKSCDICGKNLEDGWKVCPYCVSEVKET